MREKAGKLATSVAVLGAGKIGYAVAQSIARSENVSHVYITRRANKSPTVLLRGDSTREESTASGRGKLVELSSDNAAAARGADVILVAVKAGDAKHVLAQISPFCSGKIVISLMAAISLRRLEGSLPGAKIVRAMPNIAATIGEAITAYTPASSLSVEDVERVRFILGCFGDYIEVPESLMDAVTALSGSGPAYIAVLIEAMVTAGLKVGIPRDIAFKLVTKTLTGTADLLSQNKIHPAELRDAVTTPAGTTIAGIYELEKGALRTSIMNAVEAATFAAERVGKKFEEEH